MVKYIVLLLSLTCLSASAQFENYTWVVGAKDVITFDTQSKSPTNSARAGNPDYTLEGAAIANNPQTGETYFYHDGHQIFTKNFVPMIGGGDIGGKIQGSTGQGATIYTLPDCTNKRFIAFSNDADHSVVPFKKGKLYYSIIDMTIGNGVVTTTKNLIRDDLDEGMIVVNDFKGGKSWLVAKLMDQNKMVSIPLSNDYSTLSDKSKHVITSFGNSSDVLNSIYTLKLNPVNNKIAMSGFFPAATVATVDFNLQSGGVSNFSFVDRNALNNKGNAQESYIIDVCWSPDGTKLYAITQKHMSLYQYDFANNKNRTLIIQDPQSSDNGGMKIGPDGKIWVINNTLPVDPANPIGSFNVSRIHNPNQAGGACNLILNDYTLLSNGYFYFPQHAEYDPTEKSVSLVVDGSTQLCEGENRIIQTDKGISWEWNIGSSSSEIKVNQTGVYYCKVTLPNGCVVQSDTVVINVTDLPTVEAGENQTISCGTKVNLEAVGSNGADLQWLGNSLSGASYLNVGQGTYFVTAKISNGLCQVVDSLVVIEEQNNVNFELTPDFAVCKDEEYSVFSNVSGITGNPEYIWDNGSNFSFIEVLEAKSTKIWSLTVTDSDTKCSLTKSMKVTVEELAVSLTSTTDPAFCEGESVDLEISPKTYDALIWNDGQQGMRIRTIYDAGLYSFEMTKGACSVSSNDIEVLVRPTPVAGFYFDSTNIQANELVSFNNKSIGGTNFDWSFGNGMTSNFYSDEASYPNPGSYFVSLSVANDFGCTDQKGRIVNVEKPNEETTVFIPTAFTPGEDNINPRLKVYGIEIKSVQMLVYDRWGQIQFYSPNQLIGWDGDDLGGNPLPGGVYQVLVEVETNKGTTIRKSETVLLHRYN
ncbi:MAG: gliding motility-associated-like protein [Lentimonas sp.]|jgi:gliding motility-associated-like protein